MRAKSSAYIKKVAQQANGPHRDPIYVGDHLQDLSAYLERAGKSRTRTSNYSPLEQKPFLWQYDLHRQSGPTVFSNVTNYEDSVDHAENAYQAGLLFFTGHPSPEWLAAIGGQFDPDPFVLMDHMHFLPSAQRPTYVLPSFHAAGKTAIRLLIPTIGHVEPPIDPLTSEDLQKLRRSAAAHMSTASRRAMSSSTAGNSIVRQFYLHDTNRFSLEQDMTIIFKVESSSRWSLLVFCDSGANQDPEIVLSNLPEYTDRAFPLVPVVQHSRDSATSSTPTVDVELSSFVAPASRLPAHYGRTLNRELASQDPFYALHELFDFAAHAELQFLNMMSQLVTSQIDLQSAARIEVLGHERKGTPLLADFHHSRDILDHHIRRLKETAEVLRSRQQLPMPTSSRPDLKVVAERAREDLLDRFTFLIERAITLVERCERGADLALNNANLQLAERAFGYSKSIGKLTTVGTWIAVLFVPLSLVTSVFGMNFAQFGSGSQNLWVFAAVAVPILMLSFTALLWRKAWSYLERWTDPDEGKGNSKRKTPQG